MGHIGLPEARSFPWSCSGESVPFHHASGPLKTDVEIRQSQVGQATRMEASEGSACTLEKEGTSLDVKHKEHVLSHLKHNV